ncbi:unnamed protein product [Brassica oleracea var. botrytis]|uniref:Uncharacterized protein n=2 Tax=Brassica TaxID=3705 RepID=A0A3P6EUK4_BRAOL|nr:unnamed protein product [Brassica napus]CDY63917.1 BnaC07g51240D [Brassica napus]VDD41126.1 unnamed protein product [Brassica oleracea]
MCCYVFSFLLNIYKLMIIAKLVKQAAAMNLNPNCLNSLVPGEPSLR